MEEDLTKFILAALKKTNIPQRPKSKLNSNSILKIILNIAAAKKQDVSAPNVQNKLQKVINSNKLSSDLWAFIKGAIGPTNVPVNKIPPQIKNKINKGEKIPDDVALGIVALIGGMIKPETAQKILEAPNASNQAATIGKKIISIIISMAGYVPANLNANGKPIVPPGGKPGYVLTTREKLFGWWPNLKPKLPEIRLPNVKFPLGPAPRVPRNYTNMDIDDLLKALRNFPDNSEVIKREIKKRINSTRRNLKYETVGKRARRFGNMLRRIPRNFPGRRDLVANLIDAIRNIRNSRDLSNFISNLGGVSNENVRRALAEQRRRLARRLAYENENEYRRRMRRDEGEYGRRYGGEYAPRYRGNGGRNVRENLARRRNILAGYAPPPPAPPPPPPPPRVSRPFNYNELARRRNVLAVPSVPAAPSIPSPPPLPAPQQQAIANAGGVQKAINTISQVPGGAPAVARAAEALNETAGNTAQAVNVKGASPEAVRAVQNLGGARGTMNVLEGLNTMAQTVETRKRKQKRRRTKVIRPRIAELNRVIEAVKKQKLISLVAHNVTKTHEIHPNDEKLKTYYKKIIKANILRRPFAKIVKRAAKKNK